MKYSQKISSRWSSIFYSLKNHPRPWRLFLALCLKRAAIAHGFRIKHRDYFLRFHPSAVALAAFANPDFRKEDHDFFLDYLRPNDVVLDIGANIGTLALTASGRVGPQGKVFAFEPNPRVFGMLVENIALNGRTNIFARNLALAQQDGVLNFSDLSADDQNFVVGTGKGIEVQARRLDSLVDREPKIALLKIDVEGYEKFVLLGGERTLKKTDCVFFECFEENFRKFGYCRSDLFHLLTQAGFRVHRLELKTLRPIDSNYSSEDCENLIALRDPALFLERTRYRLMTH